MAYTNEGGCPLTPAEWGALLLFTEHLQENLPSASPSLLQLRAQATESLAFSKAPTPRVAKYVERLIRTKPHCPKKWRRIVLTHCRTQKQKQSAALFYKQTLLSKVLYFWLMATATTTDTTTSKAPPKLQAQSTLLSPQLPLLSPTSVALKPRTAAPSAEMTLRHELHVSNKPSVSTALHHLPPPHSSTSAISSAMQTHTSVDVGGALGLTLGKPSTSSIGGGGVGDNTLTLKRPSRSAVLSPRYAHTFSPERALAAVRSLNSVRRSHKPSTRHESFGGAEYVEGYLDAIKLAERTCKRKVWHALH